MGEYAGLRNLERIQESDGTSTPRAITLLFVALGGACVAFAGLALQGRSSPVPVAKADPLGDLVRAHAQARHSEANLNAASSGAQPSAFAPVASAEKTTADAMGSPVALSSPGTSATARIAAGGYVSSAMGANPQALAVTSADLTAQDVTFPGLLSDAAKPTTAMVAVGPRAKTSVSSANVTSAALPVAEGAEKGAVSATNSRIDERPSPASNPESSPGSSGSKARARDAGTKEKNSARERERDDDRLAVAPLPAQTVLHASSVVTRPRDALTRAASDAAEAPGHGATSAPAGRDGGYQLQVSSFRSQSEADAFASQLRARGHKAYVAEANVPGRGHWFRVRVGPFATRQVAATYRANFEGREHVVPFIVPPNSLER